MKTNSYISITRSRRRNYLQPKQFPSLQLFVLLFACLSFTTSIYEQHVCVELCVPSVASGQQPLKHHLFEPNCQLICYIRKYSYLALISFVTVKALRILPLQHALSNASYLYVSSFESSFFTFAKYSQVIPILPGDAYPCIMVVYLTHID